MIAIGSDHGGYRLKEEIKKYLDEKEIKYKDDNRDPITLERELNNICDFYKFHNNLQATINKTPPLPNGKNYYVTAFDQNSNFYLQPVSVVVTNPETSEVLVDNSFKGYQKHTQVDDIEIAICQLGKALKFDVAEEYRLYSPAKQKDSIVIKDLMNEDEFYVV